MFFNFFVFIYLLFLTNNYNINYNGIIQLTIKPNPFNIKKDLDIIEEYKQQENVKNNLSNPIIITVDDNLSKNGLSLYENKKNPYDELHYEIAKKLLETHMKGIQGIFAHYRGYSVISDTNGLIIFPRLDDTNKISIIIAERILPIIVHGTIPDHFIVDHDAKYISYTAENTENNKNFSTMKWTIKEDPSIINNKVIPYPTIIIIANPDLFFFENNPHVVDYSINILLPTLYALQENYIPAYSNLAIQTLQYFKKFNKSNYKTEIENQLHEGLIIK